MNLLTSQQAANRIGVHEDTITRWIRNGHLKARKVGRSWAISPKDLQVASRNRPQRTINKNFTIRDVQTVGDDVKEDNQQNTTQGLQTVDSFVYIDRDGNRRVLERRIKGG